MVHIDEIKEIWLDLKSLKEAVSIIETKMWDIAERIEREGVVA